MSGTLVQGTTGRYVYITFSNLTIFTKRKINRFFPIKNLFQLKIEKDFASTFQIRDFFQTEKVSNRTDSDCFSLKKSESDSGSDFFSLKKSESDSGSDFFSLKKSESDSGSDFFSLKKSESDSGSDFFSLKQCQT
jgi:hypothetical protein